MWVRFFSVLGAHTNDYVAKHVSALKMTEPFIDSLTNANVDGRLLIQTGKTYESVTIKYLQLNPAVYFDDVLTKVRGYSNSST